MNALPQNNINLLEPREQPKVSDLIGALQTAVNSNPDAIRRMETAHRVRHCRWNGRTGNGTTTRDANNRPTGPWEGSSDVAVKLADMIIFEHVLMLMLAVSRAQVTAKPQEMDDTGAAHLATGLLNYYFTGGMELEVWHTLGRAADIMEAYGHSLVRVGWKEETRLVEKQLDYTTLLEWARLNDQRAAADTLAALVGEAEMTEEDAAALEQEITAAGDQAEADVRTMLASRDLRPQLVEILTAYDPMMCHGEPVRLAAAMQRATTDTFYYYAKEVTESRPQWRVLQPWVDVFYNGFSEDIQDEPFIAEVEWVTRMELEAMAAREGWDKDWMKAVRDKPGRSFTILLTEGADWILNNAPVGLSIPQDIRERDYYMLTRVMYKAVTKAGTIGVWETLIHDAAPEGAAYHRLVDGTDGKYPVVAFPRQLQRRLVDCTGVGEDVEDEQHQLKSMTDARHDRTALEIKPPVRVHWKDLQRNVRLNIAPGAQFPERDGASTGFLHLGGNGAQQSINDETLLRQAVARRCGLIDPSVPDAVTQAHMEFEVTHFFRHLRPLIDKTFALIQKHMDPLTGIRISGGPEIFTAGGGEKVFNVSPDDIRGRYDFRVAFDPRDLNQQWVLDRVKVLSELILPMDNLAAIDRGPLLRAALSMLDPRLAPLVKSPQDAAADEIADEINAWSAISAGAEPPMREGVNFEARYAFWRNLTQRSPRAVQILQQDPTVMELSRRRLKYLKQGIVQEQNKLTGRLGVEPDAMTTQESLLGE